MDATVSYIPFQTNKNTHPPSHEECHVFPLICPKTSFFVIQKSKDYFFFFHFYFVVKPVIHLVFSASKSRGKFRKKILKYIGSKHLLFLLNNSAFSKKDTMGTRECALCEFVYRWSGSFLAIKCCQLCILAASQRSRKHCNKSHPTSRDEKKKKR